METQKQESLSNDEFKQHEFSEVNCEGENEANVLVEVKVSDDGGETWTRRKINLGGDIDESGLNEGEIFQFNGEKFKVMVGDDGLVVESLKKPVSGKKSTRRK